MSFRFHNRIEIAPGLHMNLSKGWPSLSIGGSGATTNLAQRGSRAAPGIPGTGMSWQFASHSHIKTIQAQSDIKAVHAQGTVKAVQAQAEIIGITKRVETVAKRLTRNAAGGTYWRKAAIEQAGLLDKMLDVAKASENELLIAAVRKVFDRWAEGNRDYRAAIDSGMTISECLAMMLEGKQPAQNISADSLSDPVVATTNKVSQKEASKSSANSNQFVFEHKHAVSLIEEPTFWSAFWKPVARNLILPALGCGLIAIVFTLAVGKATLHPQAALPATPTPATLMEVPATQTPAATPISEILTAKSTPQAETPTPSVQTTTTPPQHEQDIQGKTVHKRSVAHN
jgi:Protein of unknown function (DUF4236)